MSIKIKFIKLEEFINCFTINKENRDKMKQLLFCCYQCYFVLSYF